MAALKSAAVDASTCVRTSRQLGVNVRFAPSSARDVPVRDRYLPFGDLARMYEMGRIGLFKTDDR